MFGAVQECRNLEVGGESEDLGDWQSGVGQATRGLFSYVHLASMNPASHPRDPREFPCPTGNTASGPLLGYGLLASAGMSARPSLHLPQQPLCRETIVR